jgi:type I restriction enzyme S subunit
MRPMAINQDLKAVLPRDSVDGRFLSWLLRGSARESLSRLDEAGHGTKALRMDAWTSMELPIPPVNEQVSISKFLDRETAKIDALVAEQQRLIELLQEKRQAVISHAVTKGLDPDASVRRTEIEWLGDIPSHWNVAPLKFLAEIRTGIAKGKDFGGVAVQEVPYLRVANVQDGYLDLRDVTQMPIPVADLARYRLQAGDVLMNEGGDFDKLGRGAVWAGEIDPCVTQNHVFAVRPYSISSHWLAAYTGSASAQFYFMSRSKQSTNLASISSTNIMELPVPVPPREEQLAIIDHIKAQASAFEQLVAEANSAVRLMTEHRAALIAAAVTGQIDVRGVATAEAA